jgi:ABC-type multidrug transport system ATPase subunit
VPTLEKAGVCCLAFAILGRNRLYNTESSKPDLSFVRARRSTLIVQRITFDLNMEQVVFESVRKIFRHRPAMFNWLGRERRDETLALKGLSFSADGSEVIALLGPNGSGKTTTLKLLSTLLLPDAGSVRVGSFDTRNHPYHVRRQVGVAVATERSFFPRLSARENLDFFATLDEVAHTERNVRINQVLQDTGLEEQVDTLVMKFSSGMYQRLGIARALMKRPSVLLLDEPTRSLDAATTAHFWTTIRALSQRGTTILLATHNFAEAAAVAHRILLLHRGELLADRKIALTETAESIRSFYFNTTGEVDESHAASLHRMEP